MKKPIAVVITDTHYNKNMDYINALMLEAFNLAEELEVKYFIHCGDIFNQRSGRTLLELLEFNKFLLLIDQNKNIKKYFIPGNHDKVDLEQEGSYLSIFNNYESIEIFDKETFLHLSNEIGFNFAFLPYFRENGTYTQRLKNLAEISLKNGLKTILFTHSAIKGVRNNDGSLVSNDLTPKAFENFDLVLVGHYHNRQDLGKIKYIGSIAPKDFGEDNEKGIAVLYDDLSIKYIVPSAMKLFKKIKIDLSSADSFIKLQFLNKKYTPKELENTRMRVIIKGNKSQLAAIKKEDYRFELIKEDKELTANIEQATDLVSMEEIRFSDVESVLHEYVKWAIESKIDNGAISIAKQYFLNIKK